MRNYKISVIFPALNEEIHIARCVRSLLNQSLNKDSYEIIIIHDHSVDNTKKVLTPYMGDLVYFENKKTLGLPACLNFGI